MAGIPTWHRPRDNNNIFSVPPSQQQYFRPSPLPARGAFFSRWRDSWRGIVLGLAAVAVLYTISQFESSSDGGMHKPPIKEPMDVLPDFAAQRTALYDRLAADLNTNGLKFLAGGDTTQNMKLSDLFTVTDGEVTPILKGLDVPVRANVLYMDPSVSQTIWKSVQAVLGSVFPTSALWYQDPEMYHMSMYHASHDKDPIPATPEEVAEEAEAVAGVVNRTCPLTVEIDRVVVTSTGVLMGLWQLVDGSEPAVLRDSLKQALPRSPRKQIYNRVILHTSFARILGYPVLEDEEMGVEEKTAATMGQLRKVVTQLNEDLARTKCTIRELWYVEEHDLLALALKGKMTSQNFTFQCPS